MRRMIRILCLVSSSIALVGAAAAQSAAPQAAPAKDAPKPAAAQASDPKLDEVEKKLEESYRKVKAYTGKIKSATEISYGEGMTMKMDMEGTIEALRKDGKVLTRSEMRSKTVQNMAGQEMKTDQNMLSIMDGEYTYNLVDNTDGPMKGQKQAMKFKITETVDPMPLKDLKNDYNLKLLAEEKMDGSDCFVVEATPKSPSTAPGAPTKMISHFRKDSGLVAKMVSFVSDKPMMTMTMTDVKLDATLPPDRFVFKAPEGVTVQEMPAMGGAGAVQP